MVLSFLKAVWWCFVAVATVVGFVAAVDALWGSDAALSLLLGCIIVLLALFLILTTLPSVSAVVLTSSNELTLDANGDGVLLAKFVLVPLVSNLRSQEWGITGAGSKVENASLDGASIRVTSADHDGVCIAHFGKSLRRFKRYQVCREIRYEGSYCSSEEFYGFSVYNRTTRLDLIVLFPSECVPSSVRRTFVPDAFGRDRGTIQLLERTATWRVWFPKHRATYRLEWTWDREQSQKGEM